MTAPKWPIAAKNVLNWQKNSVAAGANRLQRAELLINAQATKKMDGLIDHKHAIRRSLFLSSKILLNYSMHCVP